MEDILKKISAYTTLSAEAQLAWVKIIHGRKYAKGSFLVKAGDIAKKVAFVSKGLFAQYALTEEGNMVIKRFFSEGYFAASTPSMLQQCASATTIEALEDSMVWEYDFWEFKGLTERYPDIASFYIRYMEQHWIIEKEPEEIALRQYTAKTGYEDFVKKYPHLIKRIKKQHIAAYLGITPTQMSRIFFANK